MHMARHDQGWETPSIDLRLSENEVHVWRVSLNVSAPVIESLQLSLTSDEVVRARRFYFEQDRNRFIVARGVLRTILGRYLNTDPGQLRFCYNPYGKPSLELPMNDPALSFNLSHAHNLALYAFTYTRQVGVDIEYMRADIDHEQLAKYSFSPNENAVLRSLPEVIKPKAFFNCWTRKEAYIKARGKGLSIPLDQFDVSLQPGELAALLQSREDPQETVRWSLQELTPGPCYVGALAVEGSGWHLCLWQWQEEGFNDR